MRDSSEIEDEIFAENMRRVVRSSRGLTHNYAKDNNSDSPEMGDDEDIGDENEPLPYEIKGSFGSRK